MPRLARTALEKIVDAIADRIRHYYYDAMYVRKQSSEQAAKALGFASPLTLRRRLNSPSDLTLRELIACANTMNISLITLIGGKEGSA